MGQLWTNYGREAAALGTKNKNILYFFRLFGREAATLRQFIWGNWQHLENKLYLDIKNNYGREAAAFFGQLHK